MASSDPPHLQSRQAAPRDRKSSASSRGRSGLGHLVWTVLVSGVLLAPNCVFALMAVQWLQVFSEWFESPRISQTFVFAVPIALLFAEWWVFDRVIDWLSPTRPMPSAPRGRR